MQKRILISDTNVLTDEQLAELELTVVDTPAECRAIIDRQPEITSVIIAYPSRMEGSRGLIDCINSGNNYLFAIAVLVLTDPAEVEKDMDFLGDAVVDCIELPLNTKLALNRIKIAEELKNSVSFSEFARMLKVLPSNIYLKDINGRYVFSSQTWHHLNTDNDPNWTISGKTDLDIRKDKENALLAMESDRKLIESKTGTSYIIEENNDGIREFLQIIKEPLFFPDGRVRGIIALINNVTEQELLRRELKERSIHDQMTGMFNRAFLDEYLQQLMETKPYPISIISSDCDNLKRINDSYGHMAGDAYIKMCVSLMVEVLPENAVIFRMGGDEFIAILPSTSAEETERYIENLKTDSLSYRLKDSVLSVSFGFATAENEKTGMIECIKISDSDMYRDKQRKRTKSGQLYNTDMI